jgi:hypothetical protein
MRFITEDNKDTVDKKYYLSCSSAKEAVVTKTIDIFILKYSSMGDIWQWQDADEVYLPDETFDNFQEAIDFSLDEYHQETMVECESKEELFEIVEILRDYRKVLDSIAPLACFDDLKPIMQYANIFMPDVSKNVVKILKTTINA